MKKIFTASLVFFLTVLFFNTETKAQTQTYDLKFSRALIVGSSQLTVPNNTVWKVTSIYGEENDVCLNVFCSNSAHYGRGFISQMFVNGVSISSVIRGFKTAHTRYNTSDCSGSNWSTDLSCHNKTSDPNILPMWLPAGTTLKSGGSNTFVSVIEFVLQ